MASWQRITEKLEVLAEKHQQQQWEIGKLVTEAIAVGAPGVNTGVKATLEALAEWCPSYTAASLDNFRKVYTSWLDEQGELDVVPEVSFGVHRVVAALEDRKDVIHALIDEADGVPQHVTVAMAKSAVRKANGEGESLSAKKKIYDREASYQAINEEYDAISEALRVIEETLEEFGSPEFPDQKRELHRVNRKLVSRLNAIAKLQAAPSKKEAEFLKPKRGIGANPVANDPAARRAVIDKVITDAQKRKPK